MEVNCPITEKTSKNSQLCFAVEENSKQSKSPLLFETLQLLTKPSTLWLLRVLRRLFWFQLSLPPESTQPKTSPGSSVSKRSSLNSKRKESNLSMASRWAATNASLTSSKKKPKKPSAWKLRKTVKSSTPTVWRKQAKSWIEA